MTTLQLKKSKTEELLKIIQQQNEHIITLLEENNQLLKQKDKPKVETRWNIIRDKLLPEFREGNNHNALMNLIKFISKWNPEDKESVRKMLVHHGLSEKHLKSFDKMIKR